MQRHEWLWAPFSRLSNRPVYFFSYLGKYKYKLSNAHLIAQWFITPTLGMHLLSKRPLSGYSRAVTHYNRYDRVQFVLGDYILCFESRYFKHSLGFSLCAYSSKQMCWFCIISKHPQCRHSEPQKALTSSVSRLSGVLGSSGPLSFGSDGWDSLGMRKVLGVI